MQNRVEKARADFTGVIRQRKLRGAQAVHARFRTFAKCLY